MMLIEQNEPRTYVLEVRSRSRPLDSEPIAWLFVERQEKYRRDETDGSIYEASIRLTYEEIVTAAPNRVSRKGQFCGGFSRRTADKPLVSLTSSSISKGAVYLDLPGLEGMRIGTYLMNQIVKWAKQWPDATVRSIELLAGQAYSENKVRRNRFYEQFGLVFDYKDSEQREGLSQPMLAKALIPVDTWSSNIREREVRDALEWALYDRVQTNMTLSSRDQAVKHLLDVIKRAEAAPFRWALRQIWWRLAPILAQIGLLLLLVMLVKESVDLR
ncbi:hypothetical protein [Aeromonas sp. Y311-2]|uniref:hypothetical protein n=1 Tax=Aeromonas sp. Y311-2 TaxID=2990507 RepID=UPI0022E5676A|nr:hypothetical protein [Aeromonas sp. Y311-2]